MIQRCRECCTVNPCNRLNSDRCYLRHRHHWNMEGHRQLHRGSKRCGYSYIKMYTVPLSFSLFSSSFCSLSPPLPPSLSLSLPPLPPSLSLFHSICLCFTLPPSPHTNILGYDCSTASSMSATAARVATPTCLLPVVTVS